MDCWLDSTPRLLWTVLQGTWACRCPSDRLTLAPSDPHQRWRGGHVGILDTCHPIVRERREQAKEAPQVKQAEPGAIPREPGSCLSTNGSHITPALGGRIQDQVSKKNPQLGDSSARLSPSPGCHLPKPCPCASLCAHALLLCLTMFPHHPIPMPIRMPTSYSCA